MEQKNKIYKKMDVFVEKTVNNNFNIETIFNDDKELMKCHLCQTKEEAIAYIFEKIKDIKDVNFFFRLSISIEEQNNITEKLEELSVQKILNENKI